MAASFDDGSRFANAASAYVGMLISSQATKSITRSAEYATSTIPTADIRMSE